MDFYVLLIASAALFAGLSVGANSIPKSMGTLRGIVSMRYRKMVCIMAVFVLMGGVLQSQAISKTIGRDLTHTTAVQKNREFVFSLLLTAGIISFFLTLKGIPISLSQILVGSFVGITVNMGLKDELNYAVLKKIALSWMITPVAGCILTYLIYRFIITPAAVRISIVSFNRMFILLTFVGTAAIAYDIGAAATGVLLGPLVGSGFFGDLDFMGLALRSQLYLSAFIGLSFWLGAMFLGERVSYTLGKKITTLDPVSSFTCQVGAGITVYFFILEGIPVSITQAIVGGITGVGLTKGLHLVDAKTLKNVVAWWIATPFMAVLLSTLLYSILIIF